MTFNEYRTEYERLERWLKAWNKLENIQEKNRLQSRQDRLEHKCIVAHRRLGQHYAAYEYKREADEAARKKIIKAVDRFAVKMCEKMLAKHANGFTGWDMLTPEGAQQRLDTANKKGDPVDVANFAMMLDYCHQRSAE